jgi:Ca-activated chloride channel family protein
MEARKSSMDCKSKGKRQKAKGKNKVPRFCLLPFAFCLLISFALGQSGRNQQDPPRKRPPVKPVPPDPLPRPKLDPQEPKVETIQIRSDLVTVVASVSAPAGARSSALEREDFEVLEDGVAQEVVNFARDRETPLRLVMLFDTSSSVSQRIGFERRAAARFFERVMRPQDQAALFSVATDVILLQEFTSKVSLLVSATRQLRAQGATSLYDGIYLAAEYLKPVAGRHVIVLVTDGGDTTSAKDLKQALAKTQEADAVIFAIHTGSLSPSQNLRDLAAERALTALAAETGGEVLFPQQMLGTRDEELEEQSLNHLDAAFAKLADQLRTQYTLGFYSSNEAHDGRFRKLTVRIKKPGYTARARSGYYAPKS